VSHPSVSASAETIANASSAEQKRALYLFNCAQRSHHNFVENYTPMLTGMLISGLRFPKFAAVAGAIWIVGRVIYTLGYTSTSAKNVDGESRFAYGGFYIAALSQTAYVVAVSKMGLDMLMA
jgi:glutathione S-transferase